MEKIKGFQIISMTVSGFKCYEAPMEITFGNPTVVTGGNGRGKSSLADAIAFAVTGLPFFGERGIDRLHNETNPDLQITMRFTDETGKAHELTRSRQKDRMSITYDGYAIRQTDLNEMFGERDVFLSIFNPLYFIEELGEDGKKLLERYLPSIPQADVLSQLNEQTQQRLSGLKLLSPETFLKNRREEIRELEQNAVYLSGKLDLAQKQRQNSKDLSSGLTVRIQELQREIASLEARRFENVNLEDLQEQLVQASEQYEELSGEAPETPDTAELDAKLQELHVKLGARSSEVYQPKYTAPLAEDTAKVQADVTRSVKGSDWRSNLGVTFTPKEDTFVYIGGYDIGDANKLDLSLGKNFGSAAVSMGAMQGEFGVGFDYRLGNSFKLYSQVYDFNDTKVKVGGELKLTDNLSLLGEQTDVRNGNKNNTYVGLRSYF